jgi:hypothetical protein
MYNAVTSLHTYLCLHTSAENLQRMSNFREKRPVRNTHTYTHKQKHKTIFVTLVTAGRCLRDLLNQAGLAQAAADLSREKFLAEFCRHFESLLTILQVQGFGPLRDKYLSMWMHSGQSVEVATPCPAFRTSLFTLSELSTMVVFCGDFSDVCLRMWMCSSAQTME